MKGPPLGPGGEEITWPDQIAPRGRLASSTRKIKPQTSNLILLESAVMHPRATAGVVGGGSTPGFSQIAIPGLLSASAVATASDSYPYPQQDRSNTISTKLEGYSIGWPALRRHQRRRAHTHNSSQSTNWKPK